MYRDPYLDRPASDLSDLRRRQDEFDKSFKRMSCWATIATVLGLLFWPSVIIALVVLAWRVWG